MDFSVVNIKLMADIIDLQRKMREAQDSVGGAMDVISNKLDSAQASMLKYAKVAAAAFATGKAIEAAREMAMLNARHEELGVVMAVVGKNAGYNRVEMQNYATEVQKAGISMIASRNTVVQLSQAQIDLADASKLARIAQDAAVIGNTNSSEALQAMIHGIKSAQVDVLRNIGINVSFENSYKDLAKSLGVSKDSLSEHQKMMARQQAVMEEGGKIAGAYEAAMGTAGKQVRSMARYVEDLKVVQGEIFNEAMTVAVMAYSDHLKDVNGEMNTLAANGSLKSWGEGVSNVMAFAADAAMSTVKVLQTVGATTVWLADTIKSAASRMKNPFSSEDNQTNINEAYLQMTADLWSSTSSMRDALAARRAALIADEQQRLATAQEYATRSLQVQQAYANQSVEIQRAAQIALAKNMMPEGMPSAPKLDMGGGGGGEKKISEYQRLIKAIQEKTAADMLDMQTQGALTAGQKEAVKIMEDLRDGALKLTQAEKINLTQKLEHRLAVEQQKLAEEAATKQMLADVAARSDARKKEGEAIEAYMLAQEEARHKAEQGAKDELKAAQDRYDQYGKTKSQIEALVIAELRLKQTRVTADSEEYASLQRQIETREKLITVIANTEEKDRQKGMWESIEQNAHSTFSNVLQGGQDLWSKLRSSGQAIFVDWLYQLTLKRWIFNLSASTSGSSVANAAIPGMSGGGGGGGDGIGVLGNLFGAGGAISEGITGIGAAMINGPFSSMLGDFGASLVANSTAIASAIPWIGAGIAAFSILKSAMDYKITPTGNALTADFKSGGVNSVGTLATFHQSGGFLGGGETDNGQWGVADSGTTGYINAQVLAVTAASKAYASAIGLDAAALDGFTQSVVINTTGMDEAATKAAIDAAALKFQADQAANAYGDALKSVALDGETTAQTMQRLATDITGANQVMAVLGYTLYDVSTAGAAAASGLVQAMGGMAQFQSQMTAYYQAYYTDAEQKANVIANAQSSLTAAGITGFTNEQISGASREQIRAVVETYAANKDTVEGAAQYAAVVKVANQLSAVTPALNAAAEMPAAVVQAVKENSGGGGGGGGAAANSAASDLQRAIEALADTMRDLRTDLIQSGPDSFAQLKAQFAIEAAMADAGDLTAMQDLPELARALAEVGKSNTRDRQEQSMLTGYIIDTLARVGGLSTGGGMLSVPGFDIGTDYVPRDMFAMIHEGERITPKAFNPMAGYTASAGDDAVATAISSLDTRLSKIETNTSFNEKLYDLLLPAMQNGDSLQVAVVTP